MQSSDTIILCVFNYSAKSVHALSFVPISLMSVWFIGAMNPIKEAYCHVSPW